MGSTEEVLDLLRAHKEVLARRHRVASLSLFGSVARGDPSDESDVDIMVSFDGPTTVNDFFGTQFYLEDLLGRRVDLVTAKALRPELKPYVEQEAIAV